MFRVFIDEVGNHDMAASADPNHRYLGLTGVIMRLEYESKEFTEALNSIKTSIFGTANFVLHRREMLDARAPFEALQDASVRKQFDERLLAEGPGRMRVVSFPEELVYFAKTSQPLKDIAQIILDTGLRPEEVFRIRTENIDFTERTIFNPFGKTKAARRKVTMTADVVEMLKRRTKKPKSPFVFPSRGNLDQPIGSVRKAHDAAVEKAGIKEHFRLYDLRQHADSPIMPTVA
jgi:integrase